MVEHIIIPLRDIIAYLTDGWNVAPLRCHHGAYSALAWREASDA